MSIKLANRPMLYGLHNISGMKIEDKKSVTIII